MKNKLFTLFAFLLVFSFGVKGQEGSVGYEGFTPMTGDKIWGEKGKQVLIIFDQGTDYELKLESAEGKVDEQTVCGEAKVLCYAIGGNKHYVKGSVVKENIYISSLLLNGSSNKKSTDSGAGPASVSIEFFDRDGKTIGHEIISLPLADAQWEANKVLTVPENTVSFQIMRDGSINLRLSYLAYTLSVPGSSTDNTLHSLKVNGETIEEIQDEMNVTIPFSYDEPTIPVEFTVHDAASVTINENTVTSPATIPSPEKTSGAKSSSTIVVTSEDGTPKEYTLNVTRATVSSIPELGEVTVGDKIIVFADGEQSYTYPAFPYGTTTFPEVLAKAAGGSTIESITQATIENQFATILVKAEDGVATKEYTINFSVADPIAAQIVGESVVKTWDFNWSQETKANLEADTNWTYDEASDRYSSASEMNGTLMANSKIIAETDGLVFGNNAKGRTRITFGTNYCLGLNSKDVTFQIDDLRAGQLLRIVTKSASSTDARGITATNSNRIAGELTSLEKITNDFEVLTNGGVVIKIAGAGGILVYSIQILDGAPLTAEALSSLSDIKLNGDITESDLALLNAADLTSIDLTRASFIATGLSPLNPNCLVYASKKLDGVKNLVVNGEAEAIELTDLTSKAFNCPIEFTAAATTYTRSFTAAGIYTICLPFDATVPEDVTIEEFSGNSGYTVVFTPVTEIVANTPYLITVATETTVDFKASEGAKIKKTELVSAKGSSTEYEFCNNFVPMINGEAEAGGYYLLRADGSGFGKAGSDSKVGSFRGYIKPVGVDPAKAPALVIGEDDGGATGLETVNTDKLIAYSVDGILNVITSEAQSVKVYAIDGRLVRILQLGEGRNEVSGLAKGIYIVDNRKVAVK